MIRRALALAGLLILFASVPAMATVYKTCWNGDVIPWAVACPKPPKGVKATKPPTPAPSPTPTAPPPTQWIATTLGATPYARAIRSCSSIFRNAESDRHGISFSGVVAGKVYRVPTYPVPGASTARPYISGWGWQLAVNIDGQTGHSWTVLDNDAPLGWYATVAVGCLEGVKPI